MSEKPPLPVDASQSNHAVNGDFKPSPPSQSDSLSTTKDDPEDALRKERNFTDWNGPDDPDNAQNWPKSKKWFHTLLVAGFAFTCTFGSSIITPGLPQVTSEFNVGSEAGSVAFAIYVFGLSLGAPIASPLSEIFGRKPIYLGLNLMFALFVLGTGFANNIVALIFLRFLAGFFASPSLSCGMATLSDIWSPEERSTPISLSVAMPFLGPAIGPMVGGFVAIEKGWRWTSWTLLFFYITFFAPAVFMRESYKKAILRSRARRHGVSKPDKSADCGKGSSQSMKAILSSSMIRPLRMLFTEPVVLWMSLYVSYIFAMQYSFYIAFPYVFETYYGYSTEIVGLTFLGLGTGTMIGAGIIMLMNNYVYKPMIRRIKREAAASYTDDNQTAAGSTSKVAPEHRLYPAMVGGPLITAAFFIFGWTAAYNVLWIVPVIAEALFGTGNILVFMSCSTFIMDTYGPLYGASAMAGNSMLRYFLGFVFPLFAEQMYEGMGVQWACTMLGCVSALGMCIPFLLFRFGPGLRAKARYERGY